MINSIKCSASLAFHHFFPTNLIHSTQHELTLMYKPLYLSRRGMRFPTIWYVRPAKAQTSLRYAQTDQSLCWSLKYSMTVKLLTEPHLRFLSLKVGCTGSSESTLVKIPHCWKSRVTLILSLCLCLHVPVFLFPCHVSVWDYDIFRSYNCVNFPLKKVNLQTSI